MGIKRYVATKDNTITNAYTIDLATRATGSNMGAADILETFSIYGRESTGSSELSRILVEFPISTIAQDRVDGKIPAVNSASFYLRVFNARHSEQLPRDAILNVLAVSSSWQEGYGLDMENYVDKTKDTIDGSNWMNRERATRWNKVGGAYHTASYTSGSTLPQYTASFNDGPEDLEIDVTTMVEEWIQGNQANYGFGIHFTSSQEAFFSTSDDLDSGSVPHNPSGPKDSFYTKRFFSRTSEFFFKRPIIEVRWDSRNTDDRGNFYASSSLASVEDNLNWLYFYNYVRGTLRDIPGNETVYVNLYASTSGSAAGGILEKELATRVDTGIYRVHISASTTASLIHDVWYSANLGQFKTGSIKVKKLNNASALLSNDYNQFTTKITNLKSYYNKHESARFRVFTRLRNYSPTIYNVATTEAENATIPSASFEIIRMVDNHTVINNSTSSSDYHTYLSYDVSGSYFDLDMSLLEPVYLYGIKLAYYTSDGWREQEETFKFRVEDN